MTRENYFRSDKFNVGDIIEIDHKKCKIIKKYDKDGYFMYLAIDEFGFKHTATDKDFLQQ